MILKDIYIVEGFNVYIYGSLNYRCFSIKCSADEFKELKKTGVLIAEASVFNTFVIIDCNLNAERTADLIAKALKMGIKVIYQERGGKNEI